MEFFLLIGNDAGSFSENPPKDSVSRNLKSWESANTVICPVLVLLEFGWYGLKYCKHNIRTDTSHPSK